MSSWVVRLATQSAASLCFANSRFAPLLTILALMSGALLAQLTTGTIEGTLRDSNGHPMADSPIVISGGAGFQCVELCAGSNENSYLARNGVNTPETKVPRSCRDITSDHTGALRANRGS
jgi:hypothetical protein